MNGGYSMVNCTGVDLGDLGTVPGLYDQIKAAISTKKPIMLYGLVNGLQEFTPVPAFGGVESSTSVFLSFFPVTIHVSNTNVVTM